MFGLLVRFQLLPGAGAAFDALTGETLVHVRREPGTLTYTTHRVAADPDQRVFYELYADEEAFLVHEHAPYVERFLIERTQYLDGLPTVERLTPVAG